MLNLSSRREAASAIGRAIDNESVDFNNRRSATVSGRMGVSRRKIKKAVRFWELCRIYESYKNLKPITMKKLNA